VQALIYYSNGETAGGYYLVPIYCGVIVEKGGTCSLLLWRNLLVTTVQGSSNRHDDVTHVHCYEGHMVTVATLEPSLPSL
jgi:hypothetical protein